MDIGNRGTRGKRADQNTAEDISQNQRLTKQIGGGPAYDRSDKDIREISKKIGSGAMSPLRWKVVLYAAA